MSLDPDRLLDRRRLKRGVTVWRALAILAIIAVVVVAVGRFAIDGSGGRDHVSRLWVNGIIVDDPERDDVLNEIASDGSSRALIVRIDSPGGTVVGAESLFLTLRRIADHKPVVAVLGTTAASGGYWVALGADHIVARRGSITGSIGVIYQTAEISELLDDLGISTEAIRSGPLKARPSPLEPMDEAVRKVTQTVVDDLHDQFASLVADRREIDRANVSVLADGRVFSGRQAFAANLVDEIGGEAEARAWLKRERGVAADLRVRDVSYGDGRGIVARLGSRISGALLPDSLSLDGLVAVWHPDLAQ